MTNESLYVTALQVRLVELEKQLAALAERLDVVETQLAAFGTKKRGK